jgi:sRNA-binding carbon storage regulator CsrA
MLVLNRRPGESIVIEPDVRVTVLSVADRRVWIGLRSSGFPDVHLSATVVSPTRARLEVGPISTVELEGDRVRVLVGSDGEPGALARAGLAVDRQTGERVEVGDDLWIGVTALVKGNPTLSFGGKAIGDDFELTLIGPTGSYVRLGVDAPDRRVYREELWEAVKSARAGPEESAALAPGPAPMVAGVPAGITAAIAAANTADCAADCAADSAADDTAARGVGEVAADAAAGSHAG